MAPKQVATSTAAEGSGKPAAKSKPYSLNSVLNNLLFYSLLMVVVPLGLFYLIYYHHLDPLLSATIGVPSPDKRGMVAGIFAVVGVNLVVGTFILTAMKDEDATPVSKKQD